MKKSSFLVLLAVFLGNCASEEPAEHQTPPNFDTRYADVPVTPNVKDVRFYQRPRLLAELRSEQAPMPEVVFVGLEFNSAVLGSDSPGFALYEDGKVVYRDGDNFRSVQLDKDELRSFRQSLAAARDPALTGRYEINLVANHGPSNSLLFYSGEPVYLSVWGSLDDEEVTSRLPTPVREAFEIVRDFRHPRSTIWMPEKIEVMVWPYEYAPEPSIKWKPEWPAISDPTTLQRGDSYSIFLPTSELNALRAFLATGKSRGAVEIEGRKWAVSTRIPFPQERLWMAPNPEFAEGWPAS